MSFPTNHCRTNWYKMDYVHLYEKLPQFKRFKLEEDEDNSKDTMGKIPGKGKLRFETFYKEVKY